VRRAAGGRERRARRPAVARIHHDGSIAVEAIETELSDAMERAADAARGSPSDAVVWEEVTKRTSESAELSVSFVLFMVLAALIASVGIFLDSAILIVGAMVVGPEFGPIAGICVAVLAAPSPPRRPLRPGAGCRLSGWRSRE